MGISTSRLCDRRAYRGKIDGEYRMRAPSLASRSRTRGWRTATGPMPVMISRSGRWPWRTTRCWPVSVLRSACFARNSATSASTAWVSSARAPLRRTSVKESVKTPGWASLMTLLSDTAYPSFIGEVEALNTTTIRRLIPSARHQLPAIAHVMLRSTLARWLMSAGYSVELAESERRAREVLAHHRIALTILARGRSGTTALDPDQNCSKWIVVSEPSQDAGQPGRSTAATDRSLSIPLDKQAVLTGVKSALQAQPEVPDEGRREPELLSFDRFTIDLAGRSLRGSEGREVPLTRSEFALLVALLRSPGRVLSRDQLLDAALSRQSEPYDRSIDVLIGRLRRKIEPDPKKPSFIVTVQGAGYKFTPQLRDNCPPSQAAVATSEEKAQRAQPQSIERRQLTVMSCGLVGSMALASRLDPEDLRAVIGDYRRCC